MAATVAGMTLWPTPGVPGRRLTSTAPRRVAHLDLRWIMVRLDLPVSTSLSLSGANGALSGNATLSDDGHVVTAEFAHPQLIGRGWQRGDGSIASGDTVARFWSTASATQFRRARPQARSGL